MGAFQERLLGVNYFEFGSILKMRVGLLGLQRDGVVGLGDDLGQVLLLEYLLLGYE